MMSNSQSIRLFVPGYVSENKTYILSEKNYKGLTKVYKSLLMFFKGKKGEILGLSSVKRTFRSIRNYSQTF